MPDGSWGCGSSLAGKCGELSAGHADAGASEHLEWEWPTATSRVVFDNRFERNSLLLF